MSIQVKSLTETTAEAIRVLFKEIGVADTIRFLNQFTTGYGDYTQEREQLFGGMGVGDIVSEIKRSKEQGGP